MRVRVLGSAAGGAFPQWNCGCTSCLAVRAGKPGFLPRTEDSLAVSADGRRYALVNVAPAVGEQIRRTPELYPASPRHSPIGALVLTNGDLDHVLGLFSLRESQPLAIYATRAVREGLEKNAFLRTLARFPGHTVFRDLVLGETVELRDASGAPLGMTVEAIAVPGKQALHLEGLVPPSAEDNVAVTFCESGGERSSRVVYAGACGALGDFLEHFDGAGALFFDGTFYEEHELSHALSREGEKPAAAMAHVPVQVSLPRLEKVSARRKLFTHVNNTNPLLDPHSRETERVTDAGWEVAWDGMEVVT